MSLALSHPGLISKATVRHPCKIVALLSQAEVGPVSGLCSAVPEATLGGVLARIVGELSLERLSSVLVPLLNEERIQGSLIGLLTVLDAGCIAQVLCEVALEKLLIILGAPAAALTALVAGVHAGRFSEILIPILREPSELLERQLLPLVAQVQDPARISAIVNQAELDVLLRLLRGVDAAKLVALMNALEPEDFLPGGAAPTLLHAMGDERGLTRDKVLPLLQHSDARKLAPLVQQVSARQLLEVLRRVEVDGVLRLLESANIELVVRVFKGPLEAAVSLVAGSLADAVRNPRVATTVRQLTDALNDGFVAAEKGMQGVREAVRRVQTEHGMEVDEDPRHMGDLGDLTRVLLVDVADRGMVKISDALAHTREESAAFWRDFSEVVKSSVPVPGHVDELDVKCRVDDQELRPCEEEMEAPEEEASPALAPLPEPVGREVPLCLMGELAHVGEDLRKTADALNTLAHRGLEPRETGSRLTEALDRSKEALADAFGRGRWHVGHQWRAMEATPPPATTPTLVEATPPPAEVSLSESEAPETPPRIEPAEGQETPPAVPCPDGAEWASLSEEPMPSGTKSPEPVPSAAPSTRASSPGVRSCDDEETGTTFEEWRGSLHRVTRRGEGFDVANAAALQAYQEAVGRGKEALREAMGRGKQAVDQLQSLKWLNASKNCAGSDILRHRVGEDAAELRFG